MERLNSEIKIALAPSWANGLCSLKAFALRNEPGRSSGYLSLRIQQQLIFWYLIRNQLLPNCKGGWEMSNWAAMFLATILLLWKKREMDLGQGV